MAETGLSWLGVVVCWVALTALLAGVLWGALGGFESNAAIWVVLLAAVVAAGFVAGAVCWTRGHRIVGLVGLLSPAAPVIGHVLALLYGPDESWAPTIVGDLLGLAAAILGSLVAVVGAVVTRPKRGGVIGRPKRAGFGGQGSRPGCVDDISRVAHVEVLPGMKR